MWKQPWSVKKSTTVFPGDISNFCVNNLCLNKNDQTWMVNNIPANKENVENIIEKLRRIKLETAVSENKDRFGEMGITDGNKATIDVGGKKLEIGNINSYYDGTYIKPADKDVIYDVPVLLDKNSLTSEDFWVKKSLTNVPTSQVKKILVGSQEVTNKKIIEKLANLNAVKYLPDNKGLAPNRTFEIVLDDKRIVMKIGWKYLDRRTRLFWATTDEKFYYEIGINDFNLLTARLN